MTTDKAVNGSAGKARGRRGVFLTGSTMSHVVRMTFITAAGLFAVFLVDFADLYFLSLLEDVEILAALGFVGAILFFTISIGIGLAIASSALVARAIGAGDHELSKRLCRNSLLFGLLLSSAIALGLYLTLPLILQMLGAEGRTFELSKNFMTILIPSIPLFSFSIAGAAILRALGDAKRSAYVTVSAAIINAALDPLFIFTLGFGMDGAAIATFIARIAMTLVTLHGLTRVHHQLEWGALSSLKHDRRAIQAIAFPAIMTNIATPFGNGYVTHALADFGDDAVAAGAVIARLTALGFAVIFALSGAVGPIIGQNRGAQQMDRVGQTVRDALTFASIYLLVIWAIFALAHPLVITFFQLEGQTAEMVIFFCFWLTPGFGMIGYLFVANATLNNLERPSTSMLLNWGRATLGTIPFVIAGAFISGAIGILTGHIVGGVVFAFIGIVICSRHISTLTANLSRGPGVAKQ